MADVGWSSGDLTASNADQARLRQRIHPEAQRLLYFIAAATTRQHMHYHTADLKYETVVARNIQRVNAVASAAIGLGIAVRARG